MYQLDGPIVLDVDVIKNCTYNPKKFSALIFPQVLERQKKEKKASLKIRKKEQGPGKILAYHTGKLIVSGCVEPFHLRNRIMEFLKFFPERRILSISCLNMVYAGDAQGSLPLDRIFEESDYWKSLEIDMFPALVLKRKTVSFSFFRSGKYFATGIKNEDDLLFASNFIADIIKKYLIN